MNDLKRLLEAERAAKEALGAGNAKLAALRERSRLGENADPTEIDAAEKNLQATIVQHLLDQASEKDVDSARKAVERARRTDVEAAEVSRALTSAIRVAENQMQPLVAGYQAAEKAFWRNVSDQARLEAIAGARQALIQAWAADRPENTSSWLGVVFGDLFKLPPAKVLELREAIRAEVAG